MITKILTRLTNKKDDTKLFWLVLIGAMTTAGLISLAIGLRQSIWFDEAYSILLAHQSLGELIRLTGIDTHPPLYYILLKVWAGVFGWSELSLRLSSIVSMVLAIGIGGLLLRKMFGARLAIGGVLALMLAPLLLRYGFEVRMYADASLIGVAATYALYSAWQAKHKARWGWLAVYGVLVAIGTYTLYYLTFLWIAHVVWLLYVHIRSRQQRQLWPFAAAYGGAVLLFVPWLPTFIGQMTNGALAPIGQPLNLDQLLGIATFNVLYQPLYMVPVALTFLAIAVFAALVWIVPRSRQVLKGKYAEVALLIMYIGVPIGLLMIVSLGKSMYTERYLSHVAIGLVMLLGIVVFAALQQAGARSKARRWAPLAIYGALLVGTIQLAIVGNFNFQRLQTPTVNQAAASLDDCAPGTKLLASDPYVMTELSYYLGHCNVYFVSEWETLRGGYAPFSGSAQQIKSTEDLQDDRITYVYYSNPDQPLPARYIEVSHRSYGALNITEYERAPSSE
ncbi:MAG: glycosyltransferase family 39 protein [Candidatus Saccharimonas sp.]